MESQATPGRVNDDYAVVGLEWAVVLDGATALKPAENGCIHGVPWVVHRLAGNLAHTLTVTPDVALADALAESITRTCAAHEKTCDLSNPDSPSSTVTILRRRDDVLDYLVLGDSPLLVKRAGRVEPILDERMANLNDYSYDAVMAAQNTSDGYYVANTMPDAAYQAVCGTLSGGGVDAAALLTDGASRLVDAFQLMSWEELFYIISTEGPASLIAQTRKVEADGAATSDGRKRKHHDDATAVFIDFML
ncbi:protein phosphatase 2C domain-containing protein [Umezawaea sp. Da 62-37]|uniref:protein phosphatase 2C domain-containing protein n=1 Tax=Umezawaea sp. Da 62-37 TaxID=3075927 RepID=UPI0028F6FECE|nr:protein phosphatase 2C domain-containing protein [Umezawaea sp. Da 62-37]WNV90941.1 protein phosphatase 2C domain-containing protein [Umezawaea sp. Da 62-37]